MECRRHRTGPGSDEIPRRRRTGLVRDNQTDLDCGTGRPGERSRAVTHDSTMVPEPQPDWRHGALTSARGSWPTRQRCGPSTRAVAGLADDPQPPDAFIRSLIAAWRR